MLRSIDITNMLIIDQLHLTFQPGLNVLTGETGAGKSILLDSLGFVLGWRGRAALVREGAAQGEVTAVFDLPVDHSAHDVLADAGIAIEEGELILRRVNAPDGRKSAWVNGTRATGELLRTLSETLVELHGQQDDRGLLNPRGHRALLDDFAGTAAALAHVRTAWRAKRDAEAALEKAEARQAALREEEEYLRHAMAELDALDPQADEEEALAIARRRMQSAEKVREDIAKASQAGAGAETQAAEALRWLEGAAVDLDGALDAPLSALSRAMDALSEAEQGISAAVQDLSFDAQTLDETEERLFALRAMARKHNVSTAQLPELSATMRARVEDLDASEETLTALQSEVRQAARAYEIAAGALSEVRRVAGARLEDAMAGELAPLKMERAVFSVKIEAAEPGPEGADAVTFCVATNPGAPAGPLGKIASGGELSRFLLALKVCLTREAKGLTMIFDEIDRGVGGATADAVGRRLADLAACGQILVVTHSPQVAALAAHHWRVEKRVSEGATLSGVVPLGKVERVDEIARMLAGDKITDAARGAARELLTAA